MKDKRIDDLLDFLVKESKNIEFDMEGYFSRRDFHSLTEKVFNEFGYQSDYGKSRGVIFVNDTVIKIPFDIEVVDEEAMLFVDDGCNTEMNIYAAAEKVGLEGFFAKSEFYKFLNLDFATVKVYLEEICNTVWDIEEEYTDEDFDRANSYIEALPRNIFNSINCFGLNIPNPWKYHIIKQYGIETLLRLINFVDDMDISDLHTGNIGYDNLLNLPIIIDYAGYPSSRSLNK